MAVLKRQIHYHEKGNHNETWYYLARNTQSGKVFVIHEWAAGPDTGEKEMSIADFLKDTTSAQDKLLKLIGSLVPDTG